MSERPEIFKQIEALTDEQQQTILTWILDNPSNSMQQFVAFVNSI
tara:strand:- start:688 stop:822 length:135 start_codon:yes stop_codon:yes gene_type:complete